MFVKSGYMIMNCDIGKRKQHAGPSGDIYTSAPENISVSSVSSSISTSSATGDRTN